MPGFIPKYIPKWVTSIPTKFTSIEALVSAPFQHPIVFQHVMSTKAPRHHPQNDLNRHYTWNTSDKGHLSPVLTLVAPCLHPDPRSKQMPSKLLSPYPSAKSARRQSPPEQSPSWHLSVQAFSLSLCLPANPRAPFQPSSSSRRRYMCQQQARSANRSGSQVWSLHRVSVGVLCIGV